MRVYTTCPASADYSTEEFLRRLVDVATWSEEAGCEGILTYTDNVLFDPWVIAQKIMEHTRRLTPLVAVNPVYIHPFTVARMVSSVVALRGRRVDLNLVTGGFPRHLREMGCDLDHDERYDRLSDFGEILVALVRGERPVDFESSYYRVRGLKVSPEVNPGLAPRIFVSGSSAACLGIQKKLDVCRLSYPRELNQYPDPSFPGDAGLRLGIIARDSSAEAWKLAHERFPKNDIGEEMHDVAAELVESQWHLDLSGDVLDARSFGGAYWIYPFRAYQTFCPYLVGDYAEVAALLTRYMKMGASTFILDEPTEPADLQHSMNALKQAERAVVHSL